MGKTGGGRLGSLYEAARGTIAATPPAVLACLVLSAVPVGIAVWFVLGFSLDTPLTDQWILLSFYARIAQGEATIADWLGPHNGLHVIACTRVILLLVAFATDLSFHAEIFLSFTLAVVTALLLRDIANRYSVTPRASTITTLLTMGLLFSPVEHWVWTWSVGFFHYFGNAAVVAAIWALARPTPKFGAALAFAWVGSFNRMEGLLAWIVLMPMVLDAAKRAKNRYLPWFWVGSGVVVWGAYHAVIAIFPVPGLPLALNAPPLEKLYFFSGLVGAAPSSFAAELFPASAGLKPYVPAGVLFMLSFSGLSGCLLLDREWRARALPFVTLGAFAIAFTASVALSRSFLAAWTEGLPFENWLSRVFVSAYATTSSLLAIATIHLVSLWIARRAVGTTPRPVLAPVLAAAGSLVLVLNAASAMPSLLDRRDKGPSDRYCVELQTYLEQPNNCLIPRDKKALFEASGLRRVRSDVRFERAGARVGRIEGASVVEGPPGFGKLVVVSGSAALPDPTAGTVLLARDGRQAFFAKATQVQAAREGVRWQVEISRAFFDAEGGPVRAFQYDRRAGTFTALEGDARSVLML